MSRAILIVLDGLGVGRAPDAAAFGDEGSDTLGNLARAVGGLDLPALASLGLGNLHEIEGVAPVDAPAAAWGRLQEVSAGKDSTTGHWEMMGVVTAEPFPTYPDGFPAAVLDEFTRLTGWEVMGNKAASGTEIIAELGDRHLAERRLIVYTSADSVFQIAAHDAVCPLDELYRVCEVARRMLVPPHGVSRVIARPFTGPSGAYVRTADRHDYSLAPPPELLLPHLQAAGVTVRAIGKIRDLYAGAGIDESFVSKSNAEGMARLDALHAEAAAGPELVLLNLVDFDMLWGHRNDTEGFRKGLEEFDRALPRIMETLAVDDMLFITADHGNDPTTPSTDHSREHVPLLAWGKGLKEGVDLGTRKTFSDLGATIGEVFGIKTEAGESFLGRIRKA